MRVAFLDKYVSVQFVTKKLCFYQRISVIVVTIFALTIFLFLFLSNYIHEQKYLESNHLAYQRMVQSVVEKGDLFTTDTIDEAKLVEVLKTLQLANPNFHFYYLDSQGNILNHVSDSQPLSIARVDVAAIQSYISEDYKAPLESKDPKGRESQFTYSAAPVYELSGLVGYLFVVTEQVSDGSLFYKLRNSNAFLSAFIIAFFGLIFLFALMLGLFRAITAPLRKLTNDMIAFKDAGNERSKAKLSSQVWCDDSRSEVDKLGCAFNDLTFQINKQFEAIDHSIKQRQELLADLSHDLRTPLASMQGYMETLHMNGDALNDEDKSRFISICMRNMTNLKELIDQIFELAYLDGGQVKITREPCLIGEFLYDIADKFKIAAKAKNVSIIVTPDANFLINTDLGKLERVLSNLLDNALRHTPENGVIKLNVTDENGSIAISIEDNGIGIAKHELENIFTPRYQASNSQSTNGKNVGLGLAICKRLTALLGADLTVKSESGKGTVFSFSLPNQ
ncbi:MAG: HAMP domain-containing sensor histidine kinase [Pseudomonadota bacterium]